MGQSHLFPALLPLVLRVAGSYLKQAAEHSPLPPRGRYATAALPTSPIPSPLPAPLTGVTLSFPAAGMFGQLSQLLIILEGKNVCGFLEPSFIWLLNLEGRGG